jgi:hypothetical protein
VCGHNEKSSSDPNANHGKRCRNYVIPPQRKASSNKKRFVIRIGKRKLVAVYVLIVMVLAILPIYFHQGSWFHGRLELADLGLKLQVTRYSGINFNGVFTEDELGDGIKASAYDLVLVASANIRKKLTIRPYRIVVNVSVEPVSGQKGFCGRAIMNIYNGNGIDIEFLKNRCLNLYEYVKVFKPYDENTKYKIKINDVEVQWSKYIMREIIYENR